MATTGGERSRLNEHVGLHTRLLEHSEAYFREFLSDPKNMENLKAEFFIPLMVNKLITEGTATCEVLDTTSKWFGVTYAADRDATVARIQKLVDDGVYPNKLF